jgi:hypothetical protein
MHTLKIEHRRTIDKMMATRTTLLCLLSLAICSALWYNTMMWCPQLEGQSSYSSLFTLLTALSDRWLAESCSAMQAASLSKPYPLQGCIIRPYTVADARNCLSHRDIIRREDVDDGGGLLLTLSEDLDPAQASHSHLEQAGNSRDKIFPRPGEEKLVYIPEPSGYSALHVSDQSTHVLFWASADTNKSQEEGIRSMKFSEARDGSNLLRWWEESKFPDTVPGSPAQQAQLILNFFCNEELNTSLKQTQAYCCTGLSHSPASLQMLILFVSSWLICFYLLHAVDGKIPLSSQWSSPQLKFQAHPILAASATISAVMVLCFCVDRTALLQKATKEVDLASFVALATIMLILGLATWSRGESPSKQQDIEQKGIPRNHVFISRIQSDEWKGWMQIVILLYHYFGLSKVLWVYQFARLLVASYLFMTGFGHTIYFVTTNDFSLQRTLYVLVRTNFLSVLLAFTMGTTYDLYYFPALTSIWFLIVRMTIPRTPECGIDVRRCILRVVISAVVSRLAVHLGSHSGIKLEVLEALLPGLPKIDGREFLFRFNLDAYIVFVGMIMGVLVDSNKRSDRLPNESSDETPSHKFTLGSGMRILIAALAVLGYATVCGAFPDKFRYNEWHPYLSPVPVLAFVILRNSAHTLASHHSRFFAWFGRFSLETFILQYHLWLAADSRGQLRWGFLRIADSANRGAYMLYLTETASIFAVFVVVSCVTSKALSILTKRIAENRTGLWFGCLGFWCANVWWTFRSRED